jgi:predicted ester cyclase
MSVTENEKLVREYYALDLQKYNMEELLKRYNEFHSPDYIAHGVTGDANLVQSRQGNQIVLAAFPDSKFTVEDVVATGDKVVVRYTFTGTHQGAYMGLPPTGKKVAFSGISIYKVAGGKLVESWGVLDRLTLMQQLGAIPSPAKK